MTQLSKETLHYLFVAFVVGALLFGTMGYSYLRLFWKYTESNEEIDRNWLKED